MRRFICSLVVLFFLSGCRQEMVLPPIVVPEVVVESVQIRDVQPYIESTGKTEAYEFVQIPARVSGFLREIRFRPGDIVTAGTPLFLIEPDQYLAEVKSAQAQLASAKAQLKLSEANLARTQSLIGDGAATEQDLDTDKAKRDEAEAVVLKAEAALATAQLNLSYTDVRSPITGKVDRNLVDVGNLVSPTSISFGNGNGNGHSVLTTVAGMDPIYVYFDISDYQFNNMRQFAKENKLPAAEQLIEKIRELKDARKAEVGAYQATLSKPAGDVPKADQKPKEAVIEEEIQVEFEASLIKGASPDTGEYPFKGIIDMASNAIDSSTGTIMLRGEIPNSDYTVFPGQICRVRIPVWEMKDAVLVKEEAIVTDLNQRYVFVVDEKNVAHRRIVEPTLRQSDGTRVIAAPVYRENKEAGTKEIVQGLEKGERYVVSGVQKVRDGGEIKIVEATSSTRTDAKKNGDEKVETKTESTP